MIRLDRYSERFAASGGIGARTTRRALGAHTLDFWELFLRETLQNSWDARQSAAGPIKFSVDAWTATLGQRTYLRDFVLTDPLPLLGLDNALEDPNLTILAVSDCGTWGLSGPTRADIDPNIIPGGRTDFVDLVRDTGRRADKGYAGGTYGFGKAVLCQASAVSTVVIYTRTMMSGWDGSRLIAMAIGDNEYTEHGVRYTGRHWWGDVDSRRQLAEPLLGPQADNAAFNLGMHKLIDGLTGTAILVVAPRSPGLQSGAEDLQQITSAIALAAAEYAWPHMLPGRPPSIDLRVTLNGTPVPVPNPATDQRLKVFADAFIRCQELADSALEPSDTWPWHLRVLKSSRPTAVLGTLAWRQSGVPIASTPDNWPRSQVALVRNPHFVVAYRDVPVDPSGQETFGVFLAAPDLDERYAASEPPTHNSWIPAKGTHFDPARRVLKQITDEIKERPRGERSHSVGEEAPGVVSIASTLGILLDGQTAIGDSRILWTPSDTVQGGRDQGADTRQASRSGPPQPPSMGNLPTYPPSPPPTGATQGDTTTPQGSSVLSGWTDTTARGEPSLQGDDDLVAGKRYVRGPTIRMVGEPGLLMYDATVAAEFPFTLGRTRDLERVTISGGPSVFIDGGKETEPPLGAAMPRVLAWRELDTGRVIPGPVLVLTQPISAKWSVVISQLPDAAVGVDIEVVSFELVLS
jgi:hypothetical protein